MTDIKRALRRITKTHSPVGLGTVSSVDEAALTCEVEPLDGSPTLFDVRLDMSQDDTTGLQKIPAVGSVVGMAFLDEEEAFVILTSDLDKVIYRKEDTELLLDADTITLTKGGTSVLVDGSQIKLEKGSSTVAIDSSGKIDLTVESNSLKSILTDILTPLKSAVSGAPGNPVLFGGLPGASAFTTVETNIIQMLK